MKPVHRAKFWQNSLECCGTCIHVSPADALIKPGYGARCKVSHKPVKNARKECCNNYTRKTERTNGTQ